MQGKAFISMVFLRNQEPVSSKSCKNIGNGLLFGITTREYQKEMQALFHGNVKAIQALKAIA